MQLENINVVITGGASGLGAATARLFASLGAKVTLIDLNETLGRETADEIGARFVAVNVLDEDGIEKALDEAEAASGPLRVLVGCAGIGNGIKTVSRGIPFPLPEFRRVVEVNLIGTFNVLSKAAARMAQADLLAEERGVIINTASVAAFDGQIGQAAYTASKAGIAGMTLPIARDLADKAIRVVTIAPGLFLTPLMMNLPEPARESLGRQAPFPSRLGHPSEYALLARAIVENPMLNGETIRLDGAIRMAPR